MQLNCIHKYVYVGMQLQLDYIIYQRKCSQLMSMTSYKYIDT